MKIAFLLDEQISPRVAEGLMRAGVDARAVCGSEDLEGHDDATVFRTAVREGRIMVTYNIRDYARLYGEVLKEGGPIPGVVFVDTDTIDNADVSRLVSALTLLAQRAGAGDVDTSGGLFLR